MSTLADPPVDVPTDPVVVLADSDRRDLCRLVAADPLVNAVLASRLRAIGTLAPSTFGGTTLGARTADGRLAGAAFHGGNLLPVGGGPAQWRALGHRLAHSARRCTAVVGRAEAVDGLWAELAGAWDAPRVVRSRQPLLVLDAADRLPPGDPRVRGIRLGELEGYLPAAAAMFTEELGVSPFGTGGPGDYRRRVAGLVRQGRAFGIVDDDGAVLFKADIGAVSEATCQVQGVWVRPDLRGRGLASSAMPAVLAHGLTLAPTVSLYVNDFNEAARRLYARLGMRQVAVLSTILF